MPKSSSSSTASSPELLVSVVVPVKNELENIEALLEEIEIAAAKVGAFEVIYIDDGSTDGTSEKLMQLSAVKPHLRVVRHRISCGQSAAVRTGVQHARAPFIMTMDGDGQNNPVYIPEFIKVLSDGSARVGLVAGQRVGRRDTFFKKVQSRIANNVRGFFLKDNTRDSGCGLKAFRRDVFLNLPYFDALHRFLPALIVREDLEVVHVDVVDRLRFRGVSNYGFFDRLWVGLLDLFGVWWLIRRRRRVPQVSEVTELHS